MTRWLIYIALLAMVGGSWVWYAKSGAGIESKRAEMIQLEDIGDPDNKAPALKEQIDTLQNEKIFKGVLLAFVSAGFVGIFFVVQILPMLAHRATHAIYDSAEMMEHDVMHDARSLMAQGDYHGAISAFRQAAAADPTNRLPWVEIAKIQKDNLHDPAAAIQTIRHALESQAWEVNDAAYFLFRLAELYDEVEGDRASAIAIMQQVVDQFPGTRHSANANHKLHEWSVQAEAAAAAAEEEAYIARMQSGGSQNPPA